MQRTDVTVLRDAFVIAPGRDDFTVGNMLAPYVRSCQCYEMVVQDPYLCAPVRTLDTVAAVARGDADEAAALFTSMGAVACTPSAIFGTLRRSGADGSSVA